MRNPTTVLVLSLAILLIALSVVTPRATARGAAAAQDPPAVSARLRLAERHVEEAALLPLIARTFDSLGKNDAGQAVQVLREQAWQANDPVIDDLRATFQEMAGNVGAYHGTELVAVRRVSARLTELYTFSWFDAGPILFRTRFYQKDGQWFFREFGLVTDIDEFVKETPLTHAWRYAAPVGGG